MEHCGGFGRAFARVAILLAAILLLGAALTDQASAQCRRNCGPIPEQPETESGNPHLSASLAITDLGSQFLRRFNTISTYRNAASANNNPQGGGADAPAERYRAWLEGYGVAARTSADGDFSGDKRRTFGGIAGVAATVAPGWTFGISVDQSRTNVDISNFPQSGRIDLTQVGVNATYETGNWILGGAFVYGSGRVHSTRADTTGQITAEYGAKLYGLLGEASYYIALPNNSRLVPKVSANWTTTETGAFRETGTPNGVSGSSTITTRAQITAGAEIGHSWLVNGRLFDIAAYGRLVDNVVQNVGALTVDNVTGGSAPKLLNGIRESTLGADAGAMASIKINQLARIYAVYDGRFRGNFTSHTGTAGVEFRW